VALRLLSQQDDTILSEADTHFECADVPQQDAESGTNSLAEGRNMREGNPTQFDEHVSDEGKSDFQAERREREERSKVPPQAVVKGTSPQPCEMLQNDMLVSAQVTLPGPEIR
jgi:hypothetical protein